MKKYLILLAFALCVAVLTPYAAAAGGIHGGFEGIRRNEERSSDTSDRVTGDPAVTTEPEHTLGATAEGGLMSDIESVITDAKDDLSDAKDDVEDAVDGMSKDGRRTAVIIAVILIVLILVAVLVIAIKRDDRRS